ncbi:MAG: cysteine--tRNA ligase [Candidatus Altiarchaeota archaeon]
MSLQVYNTLTRKIEPFIPIEKGKVKIYICGMTVYGDMHIGHARTYVAFDVILRFLKYKGYELSYVQNITDVDDKIVNKAAELGVEPSDLSEKFALRSKEDQEALGLLDPDKFPKVSENISEIISAVQKLIDGGSAYEAEGDVYFDISSSASYGSLSNQDLEQINERRIESDENKRNPSDFSLWKSRPKDEFGYESPWGWGRPGWHIECSVMSQKFLGDQIDIHGGALDLIFPHHENEIAQSEALTSKEPFVRYWIHTGFLNSSGEKMSKSLGNILPVREFLEKFDANVFRLFILQTKYRSPIDYSEDQIKAAASSLEKLKNFKKEMSTALNKDRFGESQDATSLGNKLIESFNKHMDNDFDSSNAIASIYEFVREMNTLIRNGSESKESLSQALTTFEEVVLVLGISIEVTEDIALTEKDKKLIEERNRYRAEKNWKEGDRIRDEFQKRGLKLVDKKDGTTGVEPIKE